MCIVGVRAVALVLTEPTPSPYPLLILVGVVAGTIAVVRDASERSAALLSERECAVDE